MTIEKTVYPTFGKVVLSSECTGIMISDEHYNELSAVGLSDEQMFDVLRWK